MTEFKVGDKVRYTGKHPHSRATWEPHIGLKGVVTAVSHRSISFRITEGNNTSFYTVGKVFPGAYPDNIELIQAASKFKVGDKVRFTDKCPKSWWFGPSKKWNTGVVESVTLMGRYDVRTAHPDYHCAYVSEDEIELVTEEIKTVEV
jgi:hypothetical protein